MYIDVLLFRRYRGHRSAVFKPLKRMLSHHAAFSASHIQGRELYAECDHCTSTYLAAKKFDNQR